MQTPLRCYDAVDRTFCDAIKTLASQLANFGLKKYMIFLQRKDVALYAEVTDQSFFKLKILTLSKFKSVPGAKLRYFVIV